MTYEEYIAEIKARGNLEKKFERPIFYRISKSIAESWLEYHKSDLEKELGDDIEFIAGMEAFEQDRGHIIHIKDDIQDIHRRIIKRLRAQCTPDNAQILVSDYRNRSILREYQQTRTLGESHAKEIVEGSTQKAKLAIIKANTNKEEDIMNAIKDYEFIISLERQITDGTEYREVMDWGLEFRESIIKFKHNINKTMQEYGFKPYYALTKTLEEEMKFHERLKETNIKNFERVFETEKDSKPKYYR